VLQIINILNPRQLPEPKLLFILRGSQIRVKIIKPPDLIVWLNSPIPKLETPAPILFPPHRNEELTLLFKQ